MADSLNPYAPGKAPEPPSPMAPVVSWTRIVAVIASFGVFVGLGLWVLGRKRRFLKWALPTVLALVLMVFAVWLALPRLFLVALVGGLVLLVGAFIDTLVAKASAAAPPMGRALVTVLLAFLCVRVGAYGVRQWLVENFSIPTAAMQPTLLVGDHVTVKKRVGDIQRGDIVVFRFPPDPTMQFIQHIVAIAGDTVEIRANVVLVNGVALPQTPLPQACPRPLDGESPSNCQVLEERAADRSYTVMLDGPHTSDLNPVTVAPGHVFVLGDNRNNSRDSRMWGLLPVQNLTGIPTLTFFSQSPAGDVRWDRVGRRL